MLGGLYRDAIVDLTVTFTFNKSPVNWPPMCCAHLRTYCHRLCTALSAYSLRDQRLLSVSVALTSHTLGGSVDASKQRCSSLTRLLSLVSCLLAEATNSGRLSACLPVCLHAQLTLSLAYMQSRQTTTFPSSHLCSSPLLPAHLAPSTDRAPTLSTHQASKQASKLLPTNMHFNFKDKQAFPYTYSTATRLAARL